MSLPDYLIECSQCRLSATIQRQVPNTWYEFKEQAYKARPELGWCFDCMAPQWRVPGLSLLTLHDNIKRLSSKNLQVDDKLLTILCDYHNEQRADYRIQQIKKELVKYRHLHSLGFCYHCDGTNILELAYPLNTNTHIGCGGMLIEKKGKFVFRDQEREYYDPIWLSYEQ